MIWGVAGLRPNFFSSGRIILAELAQESWRDLAAVAGVEIPAPGEKPAELEKVGGPLTV